MLTGLEFWHLIAHIIPVYVIVFLGYALVKYKALRMVHLPGINRFVAIIGVPAYVFHLLAFNDPYQISLRLVGADILQKAVALILGCLWWKFSKKGKIDHVINFFMLATLPNTVLIGAALLQPLYGDEILGNVVTIIFLQAILWYNLVITLYELRTVLLNLEAEKAVAVQPEKLGNSSRKPSISIVIDQNDNHSAADGQEMSNGGHQVVHVPPSDPATLERTLSAPARVSISRLKVVPIIPEQTVPEVGESLKTEHFFRTSGEGMTLWSGELSPTTSRVCNGRRAKGFGGHEHGSRRDDVEFQSGVVEVMHQAEQEKQSTPKQNKFVFAWIITRKVLNRLKYAPLTYASIIGFVYSLFAYKFHWTMPYSIRTSVELMSQGAVGMAIFILGVQWANSGKLISCGWKKMFYGMLARFIIGPVIMVVTSLTIGLKGNHLRFAILQAVIPQGVISFVLAKEYDLDADEFSTAVIFQLVVFLPVIIAYYFVLDSA